jgi:hypothetical protein
MQILTSEQDMIIDQGQPNMQNRESKSRGDFDAEINGRSLRKSSADQNCQALSGRHVSVLYHIKPGAAALPP